ncbi:hypothetical protein ASE26_26120 [Duganella sp. Root198D2]|nr:hypothetical protein ASE26_26120 [Duganella sp. Root198D2]
MATASTVNAIVFMVALLLVVGGGKLASTYRYSPSILDSKLGFCDKAVPKRRQSELTTAEPVSHLGCDPMV